MNVFSGISSPRRGDRALPGILLVMLVGAVVFWGPTAGAQASAATDDGEAAVEFDREALILGRTLYDTTAGGIGCAYCHGLEGLGDGTAGVEAPVIVGASEAALRSSLAGAVPLMSFITLTETEMQAMLEYLRYLAAPDPAAFEEGGEPGEAEGDEPEPEPEPEPEAYVDQTVNVALTADGFEPASFTIAAGKRVRVIIRNRTLDERHFVVLGMPLRDLEWRWVPMDRWQEIDEANHVAHGHDHGADEADLEDAQGFIDHDHDHPIDYLPWRGTSPSGLQPATSQVHLWAYPYSSSGNIDVAQFIPTTPGRYSIIDPLNPRFQGWVEVE